jgi:RND superfamily putative drug exporter
MHAAVSRHRRLVLIIWALVLVASLPFAGKQTERLTGGGFESKASDSAAVERELKAMGAKGETLAVLLDNRRHDPAALQAAAERVRTKGMKGVTGVRFPAGEQPLAADQDVVLIALEVTGDRNAAVDGATKIQTNLGLIGQGDVAVPTYLVGQGALWAGMQELSKEDLEQAEFVGLPIVLIILLVVFGSLAAAALPLALGGAAVVVTGAIIYWLSRSLEMSIFVTNMASMLGIGVAVDYSLFILARYREERAAGLDAEEARAVAMRTSGMAVVFSGVTVIVALAGLFLVDANVIRSMAIGAIVVVAVSVLASATLLPALIAVLGDRVVRPGRVVGRLRRKNRGPSTFWERWTNTLMKRPLPFAIGATALMLLIASPALSMVLGIGALNQFPKEFETRVAFDLAAKVGGPGALGPVQVIVPGDATAFAAQVKGYPNVAGVEVEDRLVVITPKTGPETKETEALVRRIQDAHPQALVGGPAAQNLDLVDLINGSLWKVGLFVVVLSFLVLLLVLRSVLLPIKAVLMNMLSVAAAFGVLVVVFQWGWFDGFGGYQSLGYVQAVTPPLLLAVVFGLSMDYEVFMLSRIKERYRATGDNQRAVAQGLAASAKTISSAAVIMVAVFAIFAGTGVPQVKEIGVGLAVAIALDATVVRLILVPTTMELMGDANWWLPRWLDRRLPDLDFESAPTAEPAPVQSPA